MARQGRFPFAGAVLAVALLQAAVLRAEPSATERAAAESLFQEGTALMAEQKYAKACEKFEASQQLDAALGTMLRLADCYDRSGKTASAWSTFEDAASVARGRGEMDRLQIATERAQDLEKRLSKIRLQIDPGNDPSKMAIRLNGAAIPKASWDGAIPVDPGSQRLEVSARSE